MIQKHVKRYFTRKLFLENINFIKSKLKFEQNCVLKIQKKFRQYLTSEIIAVKKFEAYREKRLQEIKENHSVKVITNFMKEALEKILKEKEELRKFNEVSKRRKGITNTMRVRVSTKREISPYGQLFDAFSPLVPLEKFNYIPNVYSIFRPVTSKQRKLTQAEKTQLHTESSCSRRKSISVCRNSGPLLRNPKLPIETVSNSMVFYTESIKKKNLEKFAHITPNVQGHTESSYNRANAEDTPPTPEFFKSESKYKKIHWNFLKPTASFENYKKTVIGNITKSTVFTTYSSKTPTPYITRPSTGKV